MPSRGVFRGVSSVLFDDPDYQQLPTAARCLLMTLRLCRDAGPAVIFEYAEDTLLRQTGLTRASLEHAFEALEHGDWIVREPPMVWVRNGLRYDPLVTLANARHKAAVLRWLAGLPKRQLVLTFCDYYALPYPFDRLSHSLSIGYGIGSLRRRSKEKEKGLESSETEDSLSGSPERAPDLASKTVVVRPPIRQQAREILAFLNHQAHKSFRDSPPNLKLIEARLASGMTPANLRGIVARKVRAWAKDPKMAQFLRPATLFSATNAEQYLGERDPDA